jgi:nucleotide-binding universal stress UspA family protein
MRRLLAVLDHVETARPVLAAAGLVARRLPAARIVALHVRPARDPTFMPSEEVMTPERTARFEARTARRTAELRQIFDTWQREVGAGVDSAWQEDSGMQAEIVAREGGKVDLIVIGRAPHHEPGDGKDAIAAALFEAPPPVLLVPEQVPVTLGAHIAVAWKPSDPAERAVVTAMPLLHQAARITVLIGTDEAGEAAGPDELLRGLAAHNQVPAIHPFAVGNRGLGQALLQEAHAVGADLLVMGAYAHRRAVEALFGGATRDILGEGDMPVFMHH